MRSLMIEKTDVDDDDDLPKYEIMIPNIQRLSKELNNGKLPKELKFFLRESDGSNEFKFHAMQNNGILNESNEHFMDYLWSDFAKGVLAKYKMKIHLDTGNIYYNNPSKYKGEHLQFYACTTRRK